MCVYWNFNAVRCCISISWECTWDWKSNFSNFLYDLDYNYNLCSCLNFVVRLFCIWRRIISISLRPDVTVHDPSKIKQMHLNFQPLFHIKRIVARQIHQNNVLISFLFRLIANIFIEILFWRIGCVIMKLLATHEKL